MYIKLYKTCELTKTQRYGMSFLHGKRFDIICHKIAVL